jgi:predicted nucleic acid-binding OB-fold protein
LSSGYSDGATTETEKNPVTQEASSQELALEDMVVETTQQESIKESVSVNESIVEQVAVKSQQDTPLDEEKVNGVQQTIETADEGNAADIVKNDTLAEAPMEDADVATITKVTTVVEETTTVEMVEEPVDQVMRDGSSTSLSEMDEDASKPHSQRDISNDDLIQDQEEEPSSWSLGIRKAWDMLTSPFKSRS